MRSVSCLNLSELPRHPVAAHDVDLFHTAAVLKIPNDMSFGFEPEASDMWFAMDLDHLNFRELPEGTVLGWVRDTATHCLEAWDEAGTDMSARYFSVQDGEIRTAIPVMPSMLTLDERVIRQDCLGYLMERYPVPRSGKMSAMATNLMGPLLTFNALAAAPLPRPPQPISAIWIVLSCAA